MPSSLQRSLTLVPGLPAGAQGFQHPAGWGRLSFFAGGLDPHVANQRRLPPIHHISDRLRDLGTRFSKPCAMGV